MQRVGGILIGLVIVVAGVSPSGGCDRGDTKSPGKPPTTPTPPPPAPQTPPKAGVAVTGVFAGVSVSASARGS